MDNYNSSVEFSLSQMKEVPEHIKEFILNKHKSEIRIAFLNGTINGINSCKGEELICAEHYYHQTFKGGENG